MELTFGSPCAHNIITLYGALSRVTRMRKPVKCPKNHALEIFSQEDFMGDICTIATKSIYLSVLTPSFTELVAL